MKKIFIIAMSVILCFMLNGCAEETGQIAGATRPNYIDPDLQTGIYIPEFTAYETVGNAPSVMTEPFGTDIFTVPGSNDEQVASPDVLTYAEFISMDPKDQQEYMNSFGADMDGIQKFMAWYADAKAKYDAEQADKETGDGNIDIGDYIGKP